MKKVKLMTIAILLISGFACKAQQNSMEDIETTITEFSKAVDNSDAEKLATYLDDNYRVVMNRLFGSTEVSILTKDLYLSKIRSKEFGGDKREVTIQSISVNGSTATAKVTLKGTKMTFVSLINLVQGVDGKWKLISDTPIIE